jgi:hypothetical protein
MRLPLVTCRREVGVGGTLVVVGGAWTLFVPSSMWIGRRLILIARNLISADRYLAPIT